MNEKVYMREDIKTFTVGGVYRDFPSNSQMYNAIYVKINKSLENNWGSQGFIGYVLLDSPDSKEIVEETFNKTFDYCITRLPRNLRLKLLPWPTPTMSKAYRKVYSKKVTLKQYACLS